MLNSTHHGLALRGFVVLTVLTLLLGWQARAARITAGRVVAGVVMLSARALDENREFDLVLFFVDDDCIYSTNAEPFSYDWDTRAFGEGRHVLRVEAYRRGVRIARSASHAVVVSNESLNVPREGAALELSFSTATVARPEFAHKPAAAPAQTFAKAPLTKPTPFVPLARSQAARVARVADPAATTTVAVVPAASAQPVSLFLDGRELRLGPLHAVSGKELLYLPARAAFAQFGARGEWHPETKTFFARLGDRKVWLTAGEQRLLVNRIPEALEAPIRLDPQQGLLIPVGVCRHAFDLRVVWLRDSQRVELFTTGEPKLAPSGSPLSRLFAWLGWA